MLTSKLILGTVQFGLNYGINNKTGKPNYNEIKKILDLAYSNGIRFLDTAEEYGNSHEIIGKYHSLKPEKFNVVTKFSSSRSDLPDNITERVLFHLKSLNIEFMYCYMFHSFDDYINYFEFFKTELLVLKSNNIIKKIGVSLYNNYQIEKVLEDDFVDLIQIPFNLFDNSNKREQILKKAKKRGIEIHTRSVFLQGLFFKETNELNGKLKFFKRHISYLRSLTSKHQINDLALNYVYSKDYIDYVLVGVDNLEQLKNNFKVLSNKSKNLNYEEIEKINIKNISMLNPTNWNL
jgi:aryl-alcohol dehydrogenase-like predicted oxidoreductase